MSRKREDCVVGIHSGAVVAYANERAATFLNCDLDRMRSSIERVLDQFLDDRCRPLDHLSGRNLIRYRAGKNADYWHLLDRSGVMT